MNTNLAGSLALMALDRLDETEYHQQQTAVRTARQGGGVVCGRRREGERSADEACPCLPLLPYGGACGRILYLGRSDNIPFEGIAVHMSSSRLWTSAVYAAAPELSCSRTTRNYVPQVPG